MTFPLHRWQTFGQITRHTRPTCVQRPRLDLTHMRWLTADDIAAERLARGDGISPASALRHARRVLAKLRALTDVATGQSTGGRPPLQVRESDYRAWLDPTAHSAPSQAA